MDKIVLLAFELLYHGRLRACLCPGCVPQVGFASAANVLTDMVLYALLNLDLFGLASNSSDSMIAQHLSLLRPGQSVHVCVCVNERLTMCVCQCVYAHVNLYFCMSDCIVFRLLYRKLYLKDIRWITCRI